MSHYPTLIWLVINQTFLFSPSSACFVCDGNWRVVSTCPYLNPRAFHRISSPLSSWGGGVIERF